MKSYLTNHDIEYWFDNTKRSKTMAIIGDDEGDVYGIGPYFSCYILHTASESHDLIKKMVKRFYRLSEINIAFIVFISLKNIN